MAVTVKAVAHDRRPEVREELRRLLVATPSLAPCAQRLVHDVLASFLEEDKSAGTLPADELLEAIATLDKVFSDPHRESDTAPTRKTARPQWRSTAHLRGRLADLV